MYNQNMKKILWSKSIWFFDVDDTLINTAALTETASDGIGRVMADNFGEDIGKRVQREFIRLFNIAVAGYRVTDSEGWKSVPGGEEASKELHNKIDALQTETIERFGKAKKWSREIFIKIAVDNLGIAVSPQVILEAADSYWMTLADSCEVYPGALELLEKIYQHQRPIFLVTGSDARLTMSERGEFVYEPTISEALKRERIEILRSKGVNFSTVSIGDPLDKPHPEFYEKSIKAAKEQLGADLDLNNAIMIGDSYKGDLEVPKNHFNFGLVALFSSEQSGPKQVDDREIIVDQLADVATYLKEG